MPEAKRSRIVLRTSPELKQEAQAAFEEMGLSLSQGINLYLKEVAETGKLPFTIQTKAARLTAEAEETNRLVEAGDLPEYHLDTYKQSVRRLSDGQDNEKN